MLQDVPTPLFASSLRILGEGGEQPIRTRFETVPVSFHGTGQQSLIHLSVLLVLEGKILLCQLEMNLQSIRYRSGGFLCFVDEHLILVDSTVVQEVRR